MNFKHKVRTITPEVAREMLARGSNPRKLRPVVVERYARDMEAGRWTDSAAPIQLSPDGVVVDGQHRLSAVIKSGCSIDFVIAHGVTNTRNIDNGFPRTPSDYVGFELGMNNSEVIVVTIRRLFACWMSDVPHKTQARTREEILSFLEANPYIADLIGSCSKYRIDGVLSHADAATLLCAVWCSGGDVEKCREFLKGLSTGENLCRNDPRLALIHALRGAKFTGRAAMVKRVWLLFRAHQAFVRGEKLTRMQYSKDYPFPGIK